MGSSPTPGFWSAMVHPVGPAKNSFGAPELPGPGLDDLVVVQHLGIVELDEMRPDVVPRIPYFVTTNTIIHEQVELAGTGWTIVEDGGMVCFGRYGPEGSFITRPVEGVFTKSLWKSHSTGGMLLRVGDDERSFAC